MAANLPTYDTNRYTVGGATVYIGAIGATPTADVGTISTDGGVTVRMMRAGGEIRGGFPSLSLFRYVSQEDCEIEFEGLEINPEMLRYGMGTGITTASASEESYSFGGDPGVTTCAINVRHQTPLGLTQNIYVWKARGISDTVEINYGGAPATFPYKYAALHSATDWTGASLNGKAQLVKVVFSKA